MSDNSLDILGIKPIGEAVSKVTAASVDGASAFLSRICLPAAEEFGLLLRDRVHAWRTANLVAISEAAERRLEKSTASEGLTAHPRLINNILGEGSWIEDTEVQEMWAGLLASSCTESGDDDSNLLFVNLLSGLTKMEAKILKYACEHAKKDVSSNGLIQAQAFVATIETLFDLSGEKDIHRLDRELDHLRALDLLDGGFYVNRKDLTAQLTPTPLGLHMYVRCQGFRASPVDYFRVEEGPSNVQEPEPPS